jgi:hypothetical protein
MPAIAGSAPDWHRRHTGAEILSQPLVNKDGAFTDRERAAFGRLASEAGRRGAAGSR